jgi:hypothetical protein
VDQLELKLADGVRAPEAGEQVGWYVTDPSGLVADWGPPTDLEMVTVMGEPEGSE